VGSAERHSPATLISQLVVFGIEVAKFPMACSRTPHCPHHPRAYRCAREKPANAKMLCYDATNLKRMLVTSATESMPIK